MNRIVRHHYPAAKLPEDLREGLDLFGDVVVTVEQEVAPRRRPLTAEEIWQKRKPPFRDAEEIVRTIREGRDD